MKREIWKIIPEDGRYQVSSRGRLRRQLPDGNYKYINGTLMRVGYRMVAFGSSPKIKHYMHRLVALAFLPNPDNLPTVNHKNLNKDDNRLGNLEWATHKDNINHARDVYGNYNAVGVKNGKSKLTEDQVRQIKQLLAEGVPQRAIAKLLNISRGPVSGIALGILWTHIKA